MIASTITLHHCLFLSILIFSIGAFGVLVRKNIIVILMGIELMLNAVNLSFVSFGYFNSSLDGQLMSFFVMTVAAAEAGVGLALAVTVFKKFKKIDIKLFETLRD